MEGPDGNNVARTLYLSFLFLKSYECGTRFGRETLDINVCI